MKKKSSVVLLAFAAFVGIAQDLPVHRLSDMIEKIEMNELVRMPIGSTLLEDNAPLPLRVTVAKHCPAYGRFIVLLLSFLLLQFTI